MSGVGAGGAEHHGEHRHHHHQHKESVRDMMHLCHWMMILMGSWDICGGDVIGWR